MFVTMTIANYLFSNIVYSYTLQEPCPAQHLNGIHVLILAVRIQAPNYMLISVTRPIAKSLLGNLYLLEGRKVGMKM